MQSFGITRVTGGVLPGSSGWSSFTTETTVDWWWLALLALAYFCLLETLLSATPGKAIMKLRVIPSSDNRRNWHIAPWQALLRNLMRPFETTQIPFSFGIGIIAVICMFLTKKRQRLGDLLAHTIVVDNKTLPYPAYQLAQVRLRVRIILIVLACFLAFCGLFDYIGRPPLVIQGLQNTHQLMNGNVQSYALGSPHWNLSTTITYPIHFTSNEKGVKQACDGTVTLRWYGFPPNWSVHSYQWFCSPRGR